MLHNRSTILVTLLLCTLILSSINVSPTEAERAGGRRLAGENPLTAKAALIRYWENKICNKLPKPQILLDKASPLNALDLAAFSKLAEEKSLSTYLNEFCSKANLLCGQDLITTLKKQYNTTQREIKNYKVAPGMYFRERMIKPGTVMPMPDIGDKLPKRSFLPRTIASKFPFSSARLSDQFKEMFQAGYDEKSGNLVGYEEGHSSYLPGDGEKARILASDRQNLGYMNGYGEKTGYLVGESEKSSYMNGYGEKAGYLAGDSEKLGYMNGYGEKAGYLAGDSEKSGYMNAYGEKAGYLAGDSEKSRYMNGYGEKAGYLANSEKSGYMNGYGEKAGYLAGDKVKLGYMNGYGEKAGYMAGDSEKSGYMNGYGEKAGYLAGDSNKPSYMKGYGEKAVYLAGSEKLVYMNGYGEKAGYMAGDTDKLGYMNGYGEKAGYMAGDTDKSGYMNGYGEKAVYIAGDTDKSGYMNGYGEKASYLVGNKLRLGYMNDHGEKASYLVGDEKKSGYMNGYGEKASYLVHDGEELGYVKGYGKKMGYLIGGEQSHGYMNGYGERASYLVRDEKTSQVIEMSHGIQGVHVKRSGQHRQSGVIGSKIALHECPRAPSPGEMKRCVGSEEDMIDFATSVLGRNIESRLTEKTCGIKGDILIGSVKGIHGGKITKTVICHQTLHPYLMYNCHSVPHVRIYEVDILDPTTKDRINNGVALCHLDTSTWTHHEAFLALGSSPGKIEVCHWVFENDVAWVIAE